MKLIKTLGIALVMLIMNATLIAQEYKFGKVSKEELLETLDPTDSSANATVLYKSININYVYSNSQGFEIITEVFERVKLYNKKGFEYATDQISLYHKGGDNEEVNNLKGITYTCLLYTSPSPRDRQKSRMPSSA